MPNIHRGVDLDKFNVQHAHKVIDSTMGNRERVIALRARGLTAEQITDRTFRSNKQDDFYGARTRPTKTDAYMQALARNQHIIDSLEKGQND
jgi:hypothetical protein